MKKGWGIDEYVNYIKMQMGGSTVKLACEQDLPFIVEKIALEELKNYMQTTHTMSCQYSPTINLEGKSVANVKYVLRNRTNNMSITGLDTNIYLYQQNGAWGLNNGAKDVIVNNLLINRVRNTLSTDVDFQYDKVNEVLYLYCQYPLPTIVTIGYVPEFNDVSEIYVPYWMSYLRRLSLAYAKEQEGRIRSKYTVNNSTFSLDGNTLLAESQQELAAIRSELNSNVNIGHILS